MKRILKLILATALLIISFYVVFYYWTTDTFSDLRELPPTLLSAIIIYLALQLIKRYIKKTVSWYDWLYYVGLGAILSPLMLLTSTAEWLFDVTKYGSLFILAPPLIELISLALTKPEEKTATEDND